MSEPGARGQPRQFDGTALWRVLSNYRILLAERRDRINALNVFPVADADTGTNLLLTVTATLDKAADDGSVPPSVLDRVSRAALTAGRGASGLILSQALIGICSRLSGNSRSGARALADAIEGAGLAAADAIVDPVDGTMVTAARDAGAAARIAAEMGGDTRSVAAAARDAAWNAVADSPNRLPVLAASGVVDSGAVGFALLLDAFVAEIEGIPPPERDLPEEPTSRPSRTPLDRFEVVVELEGAEDIGGLRTSLARLGSSVGVSYDEEMAKAHVHTAQPRAVAEVARVAGRLRTLEVTDLAHQVRSATEPPTLLATADLGSASKAAGSGASRTVVPAEISQLVPALQAVEASGLRVLAVGDAASAVRSALALTKVEADVLEVPTVEAAVALLGADGSSSGSDAA